GPLGLAIVRSSDDADDRDTGSRPRLVAASEAEDRKLGRTAWLDEAASRCRKRGSSSDRAAECATGKSCDCFGYIRDERVRRFAADPSDGAGPRRSAADIGAGRSQPDQDGGGDQQPAGHGYGNVSEDPGTSVGRRAAEANTSRAALACAEPPH